MAKDEKDEPIAWSQGRKQLKKEQGILEAMKCPEGHRRESGILLAPGSHWGWRTTEWQDLTVILEKSLWLMCV